MTLPTRSISPAASVANGDEHGCSCGTRWSVSPLCRSSYFTGRPQQNVTNHHRRREMECSHATAASIPSTVSASSWLTQWRREVLSCPGLLAFVMVPPQCHSATMLVICPTPWCLWLTWRESDTPLGQYFLFFYFWVSNGAPTRCCRGRMPPLPRH